MDFDKLYADCIRGEDDLRDDQLEAIQFAWDRPFSALWLDVGKGKTVVSYTIMDRMWCEGYTGKFLVIAPIRVANRTWPFEPKLWRQLAYMQTTVIRVEDDDPRLKAAYAQGYQHGKAREYKADMCTRIGQRVRTKRKYELLCELLDSSNFVHIINREAVPWLVEQFSQKGSWPYKVVFFDEASCLGDHQNEIFKVLKRVLPYISRFHELTASPASQTYMKIFSQIYLLDKGERFGNGITAYRERYFIYNQYKRTWTLRPGAAEEIERLIADICLVQRREKDFQINVRPIYLSALTMDKYNDFERDLVLELPDGVEIDAINGAVLSNKLLQYASGAVYDKTAALDINGDPVLNSRGIPRIKKIWHSIHDEKIEELKSLYQETLDEPIMVAYWYKSSLERLKEAFPEAEIMDREGKLESRWNKRKFKMMLVHPRSAAHGLNLQFGGHHIVLFDIFWPLDLFTQLIGRLDRPGQMSTVMVHLLTAVGTMDQTVSANLSLLQNAEESMFRRLQLLYRRRKNGGIC